MAFSVHPEGTGWGSNAPDVVPSTQHQGSLCAGHWFLHRAIWKMCSWISFRPTSSWAFQQHTTGKEKLLLNYNLYFTAWGRCWFSLKYQTWGVQDLFHTWFSHLCCWHCDLQEKVDQRPLCLPNSFCLSFVLHVSNWAAYVCAGACNFIWSVVGCQL